MSELQTDTYYCYSGNPTKDKPIGWKTDDRYLPHNYHQFTGNCGARQVYDLEHFNCEKAIGEVYCDSKYGPGMMLMLNPDPSKVKDVPGTQVDYVQLGADVLAIRLTIIPQKAYP